MPDNGTSMIRRLNPNTDHSLYRQSWAWYEAQPSWVKEALADYSVSTFDEFIKLAKGERIDVGIFDDRRFVGVFTLQLVTPNVYELHLSAERHPPLNVILEALVNGIKIGFEELGAELGFSFTPAYCKGILALLRAAGLRQDGVEKLRATSNGKVVRWVRSLITRADYESNGADKPNTDRHGPILADTNTLSRYA